MKSSLLLRSFAKFALLVLAGVVIFEIASLEPILQRTKLNIPPPVREFARSATSVEPFPATERLVRSRFKRFGVVDTAYVAVSETIRFQGILWLGLVLLRKKANARFGKIALAFLFLLSSFLFIANHNFQSNILAAAIIFNMLLVHYRSPLPPAILHFIWNTMQPILYPFTLFN